MRSIPQRYQVATALAIALLMLLSVGTLFSEPVAAKGSVDQSPAWSAAARFSLAQRLQITDTTGMTDTTSMTDSMPMTETTGMTEAMPMTDTAEISDTTATDESADDSTDTDNSAEANTPSSTENTASSTMTDTAMMGGSGPENALTPGGEQTTLAPRERRWYIFKYDDDAAGDPTNVIAELRMDQPGSVSFEVWSEQNLRQWQNGEDFTPTGAGTPAFAIEEGSNTDNRDRSLLRWVGGGRATTLYYLIVENNTDTPVNYTLTVSGPTVSFPGIAAGTAMTMTMGMTGTTGMVDTGSMAGAMMGGTDAGNAVTPTGQRTTLAPRERRWYTFKYNFDQEENANDDTVENDASEVIAELRMAQAGALSFEVWSQDDVSRWQNGEDFTPTGAGTPAFAIGEGDDDRDRTLLRWVGSGEATVTYYLIVQNNTDETVTYRLSVMGESVSFPAATADSGGTMDSATPMTTTTTTDMGGNSMMTDTMATEPTTAMTATTDMTATMDVTDTGMSDGAGPENAMTITGQRATLDAGAQRWYTFEYAYDPETDSDNTPSNAIVELRMAEAGSLSFEVWSGDNVRQWQNNEDFTPTGAGTPAFAIEEGSNADNRDRALLRWVGSSEASVRYYIIVTNNTDAPAAYRLTGSGPDVRP